nr:MAG TPA: hypothetical protein [Caudoviricetes sp.]
MRSRIYDAGKVFTQNFGGVKTLPYLCSVKGIDLATLTHK